LITEICPLWHPENISIISIINKLPDFIAKIKSSKVMQIYGNFEVGAIYYLKNYDNMSVSNYLIFSNIN